MPDTIPFPDPRLADEQGLVCSGGCWSADWMLSAYRQGIFPWPTNSWGQEQLLWFSPDPRAILELDGLHISRRLGRRLRQGGYTVVMDRCFNEVVAACRQVHRRTWITPSLVNAYSDLHQLGYGHSVGIYREGELIGGVFGISIGGFFSGESMFHRQTDGSKIALVHLVQHLRRRGFSLFDVQQTTAHMSSLGAIAISREEYLQRLATAIRADVSFAGQGEKE